MKRMRHLTAQAAALTGALAVNMATAEQSASPAGGMLIDKVWSGHPVGFDLLTELGHQFVAYYDAERRMTVAGRKLGDTEWVRVHPDGVEVPSRKRFSNVTGWDSHNRLVLALDRDGCLHLSGNMHADPLVYYRTRVPFDLTTLERIDRMTGERETRVTYPEFFRNHSGGLCFTYRDGGSGNGSDIYNLYDPSTRTWRRLLDTPLLEGEGERSAYKSGPTRGPDGRFHMLWMWRETPNALTNNTLSYARSRDLIHWETSTGRPIPLPITRATGEVIDPAAPGAGLINMGFSLGFDSEHRPVAVYHRFDAHGNSQTYAARPDDSGTWQIQQLSDWSFRWDFSGHGSQIRQVSLGKPTPDPNGNLLVEFSTKEAGSGIWKLNPETLAPLATLSVGEAVQEPQTKTKSSNFPGIGVRTLTSESDGTQWTLRWETLGPNRDLKNRSIPPPSELRLFETSSTKPGKEQGAGS